MPEFPIAVLKEIVQKFPQVVSDGNLLEGLLKDYLKEDYTIHKARANLLIIAVKEKAIVELQDNGSGMPYEVTSARLSRRIVDNYMIGEEPARWTINAWAYALGIIPGQEISVSNNGKTTVAESEKREDKKVDTPPEPRESYQLPARVVKHFSEANYYPENFENFNSFTYCAEPNLLVVGGYYTKKHVILWRKRFEMLKIFNLNTLGNATDIYFRGDFYDPENASTYPAGHQIHAVTCMPMSRNMIVYTHDFNQIVQYDLQARCEVKRIDAANTHGNTGFVSNTDIASDGKTYATGGTCTNPTVALWDLGTGKALKVLKICVEGITTLKFSPDSKILAIGEKEGNIRLWEVDSEKEKISMGKHCKGVLSISFTADGKYICAVYSDNVLKIWDTRQGNEVFTLEGIACEAATFLYGGEVLAFTYLVDQVTGIRRIRFIERSSHRCLKEFDIGTKCHRQLFWDEKRNQIIAAGEQIAVIR